MQVWYAMQVSVRDAMYAMLDGQAGRSAMQGMRYAITYRKHMANLVAMVAGQILASEACKLMKNGLIKPVFRGIVDILYEGFRNAFVNCKFTFYNILSSYYKKLKISKTSKNHSKM